MKIDPNIHRGVWEVNPVHKTTPTKHGYFEKEDRQSKQKGWVDNA